MVVMVPPGVEHEASMGSDLNTRVSFKHSSRKLPLKLSAKPFCIGLPGAM